MQIYKSLKFILLLDNRFMKLLKVVSCFYYTSTIIYIFYGQEHTQRLPILSTRLWVRLYKMFDYANDIKNIRSRIRWKGMSVYYLHKLSSYHLGVYILSYHQNGTARIRGQN